jgi:integrase
VSLLLRAIRRDGSINGSLSSSAVRDIVRRYGRAIGVPDLAPHDLRRSHARLAREGGAPLETIQHSLGHASVRTTEAYTRTGLEANAGDFLLLEVVETK